MEHFLKDIRKRHDCVIRIGSNELAGTRFVEIRQLYLDKHGNLEPSKKGISFRTDILDEFIEGLVELKQHIDRDV